MTIDSEVIVDEIKTILVAGLNTKIAAVEAEKVSLGKGVSGGLLPVPAAAYFVQTWDDKILLFKPAIFYGVEEIEPISIQGVTAQKVEIFIDVVLVASPNLLDDVWRRINRYTRAVKEVMESNVRKLNAMGGNSVTIKVVRPATYRLGLDNSEEIKVGGVSVQLVFV